MSATEPTYYLFAGKLFHAAAFAMNPGKKPRRGEGGSSSPPQPRRGEDPTPEGPLSEPVGDEDAPDDDAASSEESPGRGSAMPLVPEHGSPDANPIDPGVCSGDTSEE